MANTFRCKGCANTERVGHLIKGQKCDVGQTISSSGCSQFTPDSTASCMSCFHNPSKPRISDFTCRQTGQSIQYEEHYCQHFTEDEDYYSALGGNGKKSGCFLTTACVHYAGLPDDCHELTVCRQFRDHYLLSLPDGQAMCNEYYRLAPGIVDAIESSSNRGLILMDILTTVRQAVRYIDNGNNVAALAVYSEMFNTLKNQFIKAYRDGFAMRTMFNRDE
jgi:hypothetical protein